MGQSSLMSSDWQSRRRQILARDGKQCQFCGLTEREHVETKGQSLDVHHIVPRRVGGSNRPENLITVCRSCHRRLENTHATELARAHFEDGLADLDAEVRDLKDHLQMYRAAVDSETHSLETQQDGWITDECWHGQMGARDRALVEMGRYQGLLMAYGRLKRMQEDLRDEKPVDVAALFDFLEAE